MTMWMNIQWPWCRRERFRGAMGSPSFTVREQKPRGSSMGPGLLLVKGGPTPHPQEVQMSYWGSGSVLRAHVVNIMPGEGCGLRCPSVGSELSKPGSRPASGGGHSTEDP